jgi:competence protein ComEA
MQSLIKFLALSLCWPALANAGPVNINGADAPTLARELKGIGQVRAEAIVAYRQQHGLFRSVDELALVKGIGKAVIERNRADLRINNNLAVAPVRAAPAVARPAGR